MPVEFFHTPRSLAFTCCRSKNLVSGRTLTHLETFMFTNTVRNYLKKIVLRLTPGWYNKQFNETKGIWDSYYDVADDHMDIQWKEIIYPKIENFDFSNVLELAPGGGRNTEKLIQLSDTIHAVDINQSSIDRLEARFEEYNGACDLFFYKNKGSNLGMIKSDSISLVYCWDAAVHFDKKVLKDYIQEFHRVLKKGGMGMVHHSNLGDTAQVDIRQNPHWRSNMSKELFSEYCMKSGLRVIEQIDLPWAGVVDCITLFQK